jgi:hypothetical protein
MKPLTLGEAAELLERERNAPSMPEKDYCFPRGTVREQPPLITVRWIDKRTGNRWRGVGVSLAAIWDSYAHACVSGSVGDSEWQDHSYIGGCKYLVAQTHRIDAEGRDVQPN